MRSLVKGSLVSALTLAIPLSCAHAGPTYQSGRISNVTFAGDSVYIMLDSGLPDNCSGTPSNWMMIPAGSKPLQALVLGLWLRGDAAQTTVMVYTLAGAGSYCQVDQIDPAG